MTTILIAVGSLVAGVVLGITYSTVTIRRLRRQVKELRTAGGKNPKNLLRSITRFLFVTAQVFAIVWVGMQIIAPPSVTITRPPYLRLQWRYNSMIDLRLHPPPNVAEGRPHFSLKYRAFSLPDVRLHWENVDLLCHLRLH